MSFWEYKFFTPTHSLPPLLVSSLSYPSHFHKYTLNFLNNGNVKNKFFQKLSKIEK